MNKGLFDCAQVCRVAVRQTEVVPDDYNTRTKQRAVCVYCIIFAVESLRFAFMCGRGGILKLELEAITELNLKSYR